MLKLARDVDSEDPEAVVNASLEIISSTIRYPDDLRRNWLDTDENSELLNYAEIEDLLELQSAAVELNSINFDGESAKKK